MQPTNAQLPLPLDLGERANFNNFLIGDNSELVTAISTAVESGEPSLLYLYGPRSAGKSHLLYSAIKLAKESVRNSFYLSLAESSVSVDMLATLDHSQLICLDNIDGWAGDSAKECALFILFEQIKVNGGQLLISAQQPPEKCGFILPDLVSRLGSSLLYALQSLDDEQQFNAIKIRAEQRGLSISDDAVRYFLRRSSRDSAELFKVLDKLDRASLIEQRKITIPFLQTLI